MKVGKHTDQRDRTLCLARILYEETDEKHPMPMTEMIRRLRAWLPSEKVFIGIWPP